jgi:hypothetical protein
MKLYFYLLCCLSFLTIGFTRGYNRLPTGHTNSDIKVKSEKKNLMHLAGLPINILSLCLGVWGITVVGKTLTDESLESTTCEILAVTTSSGLLAYYGLLHAYQALRTYYGKGESPS